MRKQLLSVLWWSTMHYISHFYPIIPSPVGYYGDPLCSHIIYHSPYVCSYLMVTGYRYGREKPKSSGGPSSHPWRPYMGYPQHWCWINYLEYFTNTFFLLLVMFSLVLNQAGQERGSIGTGKSIGKIQHLDITITSTWTPGALRINPTVNRTSYDLYFSCPPTPPHHRDNRAMGIGIFKNNSV